MNRKTLISFFTIIMLVVPILLTGCGEDDGNSQPTIKSISDITLDVGDERTVEVNITDADVDDTHTISASSDDTTVATVSVDGATLTITGKAAGTATITVTATDDSGQDNAEATQVTFMVTVNSGSTTYEVGDEITTLPSGFWVPNLLSGASFQSSGGQITILFNNGGLIIVGDVTYTCVSKEGCAIVGGEVTKGTIEEETTNGAPTGNRSQ